jgi:hypothetical protein
MVRHALDEAQAARSAANSAEVRQALAEARAAEAEAPVLREAVRRQVAAAMAQAHAAQAQAAEAVRQAHISRQVRDEMRRAMREAADATAKAEPDAR